MTINKLDTLWYTRCSVPTAVGIAVQLGWFETNFARDGIAIKSIRDSDDRSVRESHFDHNQKHSLRQGGSIPPIWARAEGQDTRVIGLIWTEESQQILTLPKTGIRSIKDLKGRKLALPRRRSVRFPRLDVRGATALRGYLSALATESLTASDVEFIELHRPDQPFAEKPSEGRRRGGGYDDEVFALVRGEVDAIFVKGARGREVEADLNAREVTDLGNHPDLEVRINNGLPRPLTVDGELARNHPDIVERILSIVMDAGVWAKSHPTPTLGYVAREVESSLPFVERAYPDVHLHLATDLTEPWIDALQRYTTFLADHGFLRANFDVRSWIEWAPINSLRRHSTVKLSERGPGEERSVPPAG